MNTKTCFASLTLPHWRANLTNAWKKQTETETAGLRSPPTIVSRMCLQAGPIARPIVMGLTHRSNRYRNASGLGPEHKARMREQFDEIHCETKARGFALPTSVEQQRLRPPNQFEGPGPDHNLHVYLQMQGNLDRTVLASSLIVPVGTSPSLAFRHLPAKRRIVSTVQQTNNPAPSSGGSHLPT